MPSVRKTFRSARLAAVLPAMVLAGCHIEQAQDNPVRAVTSHTIDFANWQQSAPVIETQVESITLVHLMNFGPNDSALSDTELTGLRDFLQKSGAPDGARIEVEGPRDSGGYFDPLTKARVEEIRAELSGLGLRSQVPAKQAKLLARPPESWRPSNSWCLVQERAVRAQRNRADHHRYAISCKSGFGWSF